MFKKVTRNIRRHRDSDEDGEAEDDTAVPSPASLSSSNTASAVQTSTISTLPAAASSAGSRVKLSFEDGKVKSFVTPDFLSFTRLVSH